MQTDYGMDAADFADAKLDTARSVWTLCAPNSIAAWPASIGVREDDEGASIGQWCASHQPFHWFVEFLRHHAQRAGST